MFILCIWIPFWTSNTNLWFIKIKQRQNNKLYLFYSILLFSDKIIVTRRCTLVWHKVIKLVASKSCIISVVKRHSTDCRSKIKGRATVNANSEYGGDIAAIVSKINNFLQWVTSDFVSISQQDNFTNGSLPSVLPAGLYQWLMFKSNLTRFTSRKPSVQITSRAGYYEMSQAV